MNEELKLVVRSYLATLDSKAMTEEDVLRTEIAELTEKINAGESMIKDFEQSMYREFNVIHTELISQTAELNDLEAQLEELATEADIILDDEDDLDDAEFDEENAVDRDEEEEAVKKLRGNSSSAKYCKRLYQKISSVCHPDKTNDSARNELFRQACDAYKKLDVIVLEAIYKNVLRGTATKVVEFALQALKERKAELTEKILTMQEDSSYMMAVLYTHGSPSQRAGVKRISKSNMLSQLEVINQKIELAKWKLNKAKHI